VKDRRRRGSEGNDPRESRFDVGHHMVEDQVDGMTLLILYQDKDAEAIITSMASASLKAAIWRRPEVPATRGAIRGQIEKEKEKRIITRKAANYRQNK